MFILRCSFHLVPYYDVTFQKPNFTLKDLWKIFVFCKLLHHSFQCWPESFQNVIKKCIKNLQIVYAHKVIFTILSMSIFTRAVILEKICCNDIVV